MSDAQVNLQSAVDRLLSSIPGLQFTAADWKDGRVELQFDHKCQGLLERAWPDVYRLGLDCGCFTHMECEDTLITRTVFDTASAAPDYQVEQGGRMVVTIRRQDREEVAA